MTVDQLCEIAKRPFEDFTYELRPVSCGRSNCNRCPHGPYWYAFYRDGNKVITKYLGKHLPDHVLSYIQQKKPTDVTEQTHQI